MENDKKHVVAPGREESISLKENKVLAANDNKKKENKSNIITKTRFGNSANKYINF